MNEYDAINRLNDLAADMDDAQQELKSITKEMGNPRYFVLLTLVQKQIDYIVNKLQRRINQKEALEKAQKVGTT